jgi:uncharacterized membrane protein YgdD (TMEM256/DUF423 family)
MVFAVLATLSGCLAVALGAFGAHALKARLDPDLLAIFETGVRYQFYHVIGLLAAAWAIHLGGQTAARAAGWLFVAGTIVFSGTLYVLALSGARWLGAITPIGGVAFIAGWLSLAWAFWQLRAG